MRYMLLIITISFALNIVGCGEKKESFDTTELQRITAKTNGTFLAQTFRASSVYMKDFDILSRGDSTIMPNCPQGDGWVSVDFVSPDKSKIIEVKCSSYSAGIGCMTKDDFKSRAQYASQDGKCNKDVPFPIPKVNS